MNNTMSKNTIAVTIPNQTNKIQQQINALKEILRDDKKSKEIHTQALIDLEKVLITDFVCTEWYKLSDDAEGKDCFTKETIDNKDTDKIMEVLKNRTYINHVYYSLAVNKLNECFDDCEQLIIPQEVASYYSDIIDIIVNVIDIDDMEFRLDCLLS